MNNIDDIVEVTLYSAESGEIIRHFWGQPLQFEVNKELFEHPYVKGNYSSETHYVDVSTQTILDRPQNPTNLNGLVLSDVPPNSEITIENETYPCPDGGDVTLNFQHPGTYIVTVSCFPYLDKEFEIDYQP